MYHHVIYEILLVILYSLQWTASLYQPRHCNCHLYHVYQDRCVLHYQKPMHNPISSLFFSILTFFSEPCHPKKLSHMDYLIYPVHSLKTLLYKYPAHFSGIFQSCCTTQYIDAITEIPVFHICTVQLHFQAPLFCSLLPALYDP